MGLNDIERGLDGIGLAFLFIFMNEKKKKNKQKRRMWTVWRSVVTDEYVINYTFSTHTSSCFRLNSVGYCWNCDDFIVINTQNSVTRVARIGCHGNGHGKVTVGSSMTCYMKRVNSLK